MAGMLDWFIERALGQRAPGATIGSTIAGSMAPADDWRSVQERNFADDAATAAARRLRGTRMPNVTEFEMPGPMLLPPRVSANPYPESGMSMPYEGPAIVPPPPVGGAGTEYLPGSGMEPDPVNAMAAIPHRMRPRSANDPADMQPEAGAPLSLAPPMAAMGVEFPGAPKAGAGGFDIAGGLNRFLKPENAPMLLALASGFAGAPSIGTGMRRAFGAAAPVATVMRKEQTGQLNQAETYRALIARGVPAVEAMAAIRNPEILKATIAKHFGDGELKVVNDRLVRVPKGGGPVQELADYSDKEEKKAPAGYRWDGETLKFIKGGPADPETLRLRGERNNAPPGYVWVDAANPEKGLKAIVGGPAEKVDAPVAARLGLAQSFLDQLPDIRRGVAAGEATGLWDGAMGKLNVGRAGELRRQIDSGAEALLRNLTGAGMNREEAQNYVRRYQLEALDTQGTVVSKLAQLERELQYTMEAVRKGRGGTIKIADGKLIPGDAAPGSVTATKVKWREVD